MRKTITILAAIAWLCVLSVALLQVVGCAPTVVDHPVFGLPDEYK